MQVLEHRRRQEEGEVESGKDAALYRQFLAAFLPAFCRTSNNLLDAQVGCGGAWRAGVMG